MSLPALLGGSPRTLGGLLRHPQLAGSTVAGLAVVAPHRLKAGVPRSASKVLPLRLRTSGQKKQSPPQFRTQQTQF